MCIKYMSISSTASCVVVPTSSLGVKPRERWRESSRWCAMVRYRAGPRCLPPLHVEGRRALWQQDSCSRSRQQRTGGEMVACSIRRSARWLGKMRVVCRETAPRCRTDASPVTCGPIATPLATGEAPSNPRSAITKSTEGICSSGASLLSRSGPLRTAVGTGSLQSLGVDVCPSL